MKECLAQMDAHQSNHNTACSESVRLLWDVQKKVTDNQSASTVAANDSENRTEQHSASKASPRQQW